MSHMMLDLETLGTEPGCAIASIGAVEFDADGLGDDFYWEVNLASNEEAGLEIEAKTLGWWLQQDEEAQRVLQGGADLEPGLRELSDFYGGYGKVWGNSPSFDCEILKAAYDAVGLGVPWSYQDERCYRTLRDLPQAVWVEREGTHHNALDDAKHQARKAYKTLNKYHGLADDEVDEE